MKKEINKDNKEEPCTTEPLRHNAVGSGVLWKSPLQSCLAKPHSRNDHDQSGGEDRRVQFREDIRSAEGTDSQKAHRREYRTREPTAAEYARHQRSHMPCRSWCPACVAGRA